MNLLPTLPLCNIATLQLCPNPTSKIRDRLCPKRKFPTTESPVGAEDSSISYHVAADLSHYTGQTLVIGETVFLSDEGVDFLASTSGNFDDVNAYSFIDSDRNVIDGLISTQTLHSSSSSPYKRMPSRK